MRKIIKKIVAIAMAFTLIGTGTAITKTISPKSDSIIIVYAGGVPQNHCDHPKRFQYDHNGYKCCEACGKRLYRLPTPAPTPTPRPTKHFSHS